MLSEQGLLPQATAIDADVFRVDCPATGVVRVYADTRASGRPLVLLHSINAAPSAMEIKPLFEHYRRQRPVFAPDLPGFGLSERRAMNYQIADYTRALGTLLSNPLCVGADIVALSLTSELVARAVLEQGLAVNSLTLVSPTGFSARRFPGATATRRLQRVFGTPLLGAGLYRGLASRPSIRFYLNKAFTGRAPATLVDYACLTTRHPNARYAALTFLSFALFTRDVRESVYGPLTQPVLVLYDRDPNIDFDRLPEFIAGHPNWRALRLEPSFGLPHWEDLDATAAALESFWAQAGD